MKTTEVRLLRRYLSPQTATLLKELEEECQAILKLLAQLELPGLREEQVEDLIGELSAAILHLHEHTRGLDELLDKEGSTADRP
jgi:hypothetical protein